MHCPECSVEVEGSWRSCPLCNAALGGVASQDPFPAIELKFSRRRIVTVLFLTSLAVILLSFAAQLLFSRAIDDIGPFRYAWLGVTAMWLVVLMAVRKRSNLAKGTVYTVVLIGLVCTYWDYLTGWHGWALSYVVPIVCACSIVALLITVRVMRIEVGEYIVYSGLTVVLGLAPLAFLFLGWVTNPAPSSICGALSLLALGLLQLSRGAEVKHELSKRLHL
ncbi:DUF6320 domain-containing protein [uncultured Agrococcus sp.]|uniref:DUF6320 domain-containing protein n=1 Tax=uncultured Agrococcus sp. TaxID=382258 RepID=UPI00344B515A